MLSQCVTSFLIRLVSRASRGSPWNIDSCQFHVTNVTRRKKQKKGKKGESEFKMIKIENCDDQIKPFLEPYCKNAVVVGGSEGFGFAAADYLLCKGARTVIIADDDSDEGRMAARILCDCYGKDRAQFLLCDVRNRCHFEAGLQQALNRLSRIDVLFNNLDKERFPTKCLNGAKSENYTTRTIRTGMNYLGKDHGGAGGIIVNCASIFGFLGWPEDPFPIYCRKEPVIEVTMDHAKENKEEETGIRLVALCPTNRLFPEIGLPSFPEPIPNRRVDTMPQCVPTSKHQVGPALSYVMAWAQSGSAWLVEPEISVHKVPRLIHFPEKEGEKVDPKLYGTQRCNVKLRSDCNPPPKTCDRRKCGILKRCGFFRRKNCVQQKKK